jgi:ferredoxin
MGGRPGPRPAQPARYLEAMKVKVDSEKCQGHNRCYAIAPELFDIDDLGYASEKGDGTVTPELEEKAKLAVENCPERAIYTVED